MTDVLTLWRRAGRVPLGDRLFSTMFGMRAPYFRSVRPRFVRIEPHHAALVVRDRRRVHNHLGTVHAIALCNGLEAAMGALAEATIAPDRRWIPKGMQVAYTAKATGDVTCSAETSPADWSGDDPRDVPVRVRGELADGTVVVDGVITLWITPRR
jgi:acyl-coenzyme A thioesterase PaaI-like protein